MGLRIADHYYKTPYHNLQSLHEHIWLGVAVAGAVTLHNQSASVAAAVVALGPRPLGPLSCGTAGWFCLAAGRRPPSRTGPLTCSDMGYWEHIMLVLKAGRTVMNCSMRNLSAPLMLKMPSSTETMLRLEPVLCCMGMSRPFLSPCHGSPYSAA